MNDKFEPTSRFQGCPPICIEANLPAFVTRENMIEFLEHTNGVGRIQKEWVCHYCGCWHVTCKAPAPAGESSGTARR